MRVHHVGYLVKDINASLAAFASLGFSGDEPPVWDAIRKCFIVFISNGGYVVELIEPSKDSSLYSLLKHYKNAPYHLCFVCDTLEASIEELHSQGFMPFREPEAAPAISEHARVAFLMHSKMGIIELLEEIEPQDDEASFRG